MEQAKNSLSFLTLLPNQAFLFIPFTLPLCSFPTSSARSHFPMYFHFPYTKIDLYFFSLYLYVST